MNDVWLRGGPPVHPWVYEKRVRNADRGVRDGDVVRLLTREGKPCGFGFYHRRSLVRVRVLSYDPDVYPDETWLRGRIQAAAALREVDGSLSDVTNAWRLVHAEGDGLSGLVVDRYGPWASASIFSLGWERRLDELRRVLAEEAGLEEVFVRGDARAATHEGLSIPEPRSRGSIEIHEHGVRFLIDPAGGHKTGFFLDQRENRHRLAQWAEGRTVFDGMTYTGGFALAAACGGAASVRAMDLDEDAVAQARGNAKLNDCSVQFEHGDVFDALRGMKAGPEEERPEILVVDPPKWARDRVGLSAAMARYRDLNRLAMEAVRSNGLVVTSSCSGLVTEPALVDSVRGVALDVQRAVTFVHVGGAGPDHPWAGVHPEGRYLKCFFLRVGAPGSGPGRGEGRPPFGERPDRGDGPRRPPSRSRERR